MCIPPAMFQCGIGNITLKVKKFPEKNIFYSEFSGTTNGPTLDSTFHKILANISLNLPFCLRLLEKYLPIHGKQK